MESDKKRKLESFGRLQPPSFSGAESEDAQGFLDKFVPQSHREELRRQFEQLRQDGMFVTQYEMMFFELARHVIWLVPTYRGSIKWFIDDLTYQLRLLVTREKVSGTTFDEVVDIARQIEVVHSQERGETEAKRPRCSGSFGGVPSGGSRTIAGVVLIGPLRRLIQLIVVH
ncbi:uncharacterized protein [Nicotiana tomentosiformis]|uniref:uncharacterized protein n=1 Tax=Nicotiana tomentosiformis TaxID=4098 RepID=UPI00388C89A2